MSSLSYLRSVLHKIIEFDFSFAFLPDFEKLIFIMPAPIYHNIVAMFVYNAFCLTNKPPQLPPF